MRTPPTPQVRDEMARKAEAIFASQIAAEVSGRAPSDYVLIDVETGDYEVDPSEIAAAQRLQERRPDGLVWMRRVGSPYGRRMAGRQGRSRT